MRYVLEIKEEALLDLSEAYAWYEEQQHGLGEQLLSIIDDYFEAILSNPFLFQQHKEFRVAIIKKFPYKIVYALEDKTIIVYAFYHHKRNPKHIKKRKK